MFKHSQQIFFLYQIWLRHYNNNAHPLKHLCFLGVMHVPPSLTHLHRYITKTYQLSVLLFSCFTEIHILIRIAAPQQKLFTKIL